MTQEKQLARVLDKARRLERTYEARIFTRLLDMPMEAFSCTEHLYAPPEDAAYAPIAGGDVWGGAWQSLWLRGTFTVPEALAGRPLYVLPRLGGWEGFLFLDGVPHAIFTNKYTTETHGNHYAARITPGAAAGTAFRLDFGCSHDHDAVGEHLYAERRPAWDHLFLFHNADRNRFDGDGMEQHEIRLVFALLPTGGDCPAARAGRG